MNILIKLKPIKRMINQAGINSSSVRIQNILFLCVCLKNESEVGLLPYVVLGTGGLRHVSALCT